MKWYHTHSPAVAITTVAAEQNAVWDHTPVANRQYLTVYVQACGRGVRTSNIITVIAELSGRGLSPLAQQTFKIIRKEAISNTTSMFQTNCRQNLFSPTTKEKNRSNSLKTQLQNIMIFRLSTVNKLLCSYFTIGWC